MTASNGKPPETGSPSEADVARFGALLASLTTGQIHHVASWGPGPLSIMRGAIARGEERAVLAILLLPEEAIHLEDRDLSLAREMVLDRETGAAALDDLLRERGLR